MALWGFTILHAFGLGGDSQQIFDIRKLASASELKSLPPLDFAYDPLKYVQPNVTKPLPIQPSGLNEKNEFLAINAIKLDPIAAGLPFRSSVDHVYVSKHWDSNRAETLKLLELLASDKSASDIAVEHGITLAKLAKKALRPGLEHQMALAAVFMYPGANSRRIRLIAALMILYFVFDDKVEETPNHTLAGFRNDFLRRLEGHPSNTTKPSELQDHISEIVGSIEQEDQAGGNGGREMLQALRNAFQCVHPDPNGFANVKDYLKFRRLNVGAAFVVAAAKFSIKSSVSTSDERFERFLALASDHLGLVNDLASYEKELKALQRGDTQDMINIVDVVKKATCLDESKDAKKIVWTLQLQIEKQMKEEIEGFKKQSLGDEDWWFLEAVLSTAVGNVMFCMTTSRYGGETGTFESKLKK